MEVVNVLNAYSNMSDFHIILLITIIGIFMSMATWLISNYGITVKNFSIGGSKAILNRSRYDSLLKDSLDKDILKEEAHLKSGINSVIKRKGYEFANLLKESCYFISITAIRSFEDILQQEFNSSSFLRNLKRKNKPAYINFLVQSLSRDYSIVIRTVKDKNCFLTEYETIKENINDIITSFVEISLSMYKSSIDDRIKIYNRSKPLFKDTFFREHCCDKHILELRTLLNSLE
ncbi:MAG: hypothetical protein ACRCZB_05445 [Bacteroidales bacterium]